MVKIRAFWQDLLQLPDTTALGGVLVGCSTSRDPSPPAAEPADAPPAAEPAGRVIDIGARPEGVVADGDTGLVAVGVREHNALALVDGRTGKVAERVELPGNVRHLQLAGPGGPVLLPSESANTLLTVELPSGEIAERLPTGKFPHDATAADNGTIFVTNEFGGSLAVVRDGAVVRTLGGQTSPAALLRTATTWESSTSSRTTSRSTTPRRCDGSDA